MGIQRAVCAVLCSPGASGEGVQPVQHIGGREAVGVAVVGEAVAEVGQELQIETKIKKGLLVEDNGESLEGAAGPGAAEEAGELEERLDDVLLARGEVGWEGGTGHGGQFMQQGEQVDVGPMIEAVSDGLDLGDGVAEIKALGDRVIARDRVIR